MAVLKIYGDIGEPDKMMQMFGITDDSVSAKMVADWLDEHKDDSDITVRINSRGGDVQEGWAIYDLLVNSGKKITTIGEGKVYSIATIIFLAGSEREMMKNADGLIHNPYIPEYSLSGAYESSDLIRIAENLKQEEEKILEFYAEKTGTDKAKLAEYMKEDTKLSAEDMVTLGFATKVSEPIKAYAYKSININKMTEKDVQTFGQKLDTIIAGFSRLFSKNQEMTDKDGNKFNLDKESGDPAVGDKASPDGSYTMASGKTIVVAGGAITEIKEPAQDKLAEANAEIERLKGELTNALAAKAESDRVKAEAEAEKIAAVALKTELQNLKNTWVPEGRQSGNKVDGIDKVKEYIENANKTDKK